jgi:hypothetical protein
VRFSVLCASGWLAKLKLLFVWIRGARRAALLLCGFSMCALGLLFITFRVIAFGFNIRIIVNAIKQVLLIGFDQI